MTTISPLHPAAPHNVDSNDLVTDGERQTTCTLENGLRIIQIPSTTDVCYAGWAVKAGTRHELPDETGLAHLVEHMIFKGTKSRKAADIPQQIEKLGAELNAYTTKEEMVLYTVCMKEHLQKAMALMADMMWNSIFPTHELEKEIEVVRDEIMTTRDTPAELIFDEFEEMAMKNHPLGRNILGTEEALEKTTRAALTNFYDRCYKPHRAIAFVKGNIDMEKLVKICRKMTPEKRQTGGETTEGHRTNSLQATTSLPGQPKDGAAMLGGERETNDCSHNCRGDLTCQKPETKRVNRQTHQAHTVIGGWRASAPEDTLGTAMALMMNLLGGPFINSRLNKILREKHALVYNIEANLCGYTDRALWSIYFGCDKEDINKCCRLVMKELERLKKEGLDGRKLEAAKRQLKGWLGISSDNFENSALQMAKAFLHYGHYETLHSLKARIDKLTPQDIKRAADEAFDTGKMKILIFDPE
ncbi:MAG: insulinase family protein [Bacteroidaceae bacterium]|nr:insulinase family protein [Bacteroidaceae bacterium]